MDMTLNASKMTVIVLETEGTFEECKVYWMEKKLEVTMEFLNIGKSLADNGCLDKT